MTEDSNVKPEELDKKIEALRARLSKIKFKTKTKKVSKYWYEGKLITKAEFDRLTWEQVHASNNVIRK